MKSTLSQEMEAEERRAQKTIQIMELYIRVIKAEKELIMRQSVVNIITYSLVYS